MPSAESGGSISAADAVTKTAGGGAPAFTSDRDAIERGHSVGRYLVLESLGAGGMGVVYLAYDPELERKVAIKLLKPRQGDTVDGSRAADLLREGRAVARLAHTNVITVFDVGRIGDELFIAMEYVDGKTLTRWCADDAPTKAEILRVHADAARGLVAAHDAGLVHRDFKPGNVMVDSTGRVVVLDFGLAIRQESESTARDRDTDASASSDAVSTAGTPAYMAPELQRGEAPDGRSDQFAFCVALYQALCGEHPFRRGNMALVHSMFTTDAREPPADAMPPAVWPVLRRGLSRDPDARYPSMAALLSALEPRERRGSRWLLAGLLGLVGIGSVFGTGETPPCGGGSSFVDEVWSGEARAALRASRGEADTQPIEEGLDAYANAWAEASDAACRATHVDKTQSTELLDLRTACLRRRRLELGALLDSANDERVSLSRLREAVLSLESPSGCDDVERLLSVGPPPTDPVTRDAVESLDAEVAAVASRIQLALDPPVGLARAVSVRARAEALGHAPLIARAAKMHAQSLRNLQLTETALEPANRALLAAEAAGDDLAVLTAAAELSYLHAVNHEPREAARWIAFAKAKQSRLPQNREAEVRVLTTLGLVQRKRGDVQPSVESLQRALELVEGSDQAGSATHGNILGSLALSYRQVGAHELAIETGRHAIEVRTALLGGGHPLVGETLFNLAMAQVNVGDSAGALESLSDARTTLLDDDPRSRRAIVFDGQTGVALAVAGDLEGARRLLERGLALGREVLKPRHFDLNPLLVNLARVELMQERPQRALEHAREAIAIAETHYGSDYPDMVPDLLVLAEIYAALEKKEEALETLHRAERIATTDSDRQLCQRAIDGLGRDEAPALP